jgi:hypothetical protein
MDTMLDVKQQICDWTHITKDCLNDIALEDVEMSAYALDSVAAATHQMAGFPEGCGAAPDLEGPLACRSYWVEHTRELIVFFWNAGEARAVVVPAEGWMLKSDITIH